MDPIKYKAEELPRNKNWGIRDLRAVVNTKKKKKDCS